MILCSDPPFFGSPLPRGSERLHVRRQYTIQCNTKQYNTIQHNTAQYNTIQYNTIQYNTTLVYTILYYTTLCYTILYQYYNIRHEDLNGFTHSDNHPMDPRQAKEEQRAKDQARLNTNNNRLDNNNDNKKGSGTPNN